MLRDIIAHSHKHNFLTVTFWCLFFFLEAVYFSEDRLKNVRHSMGRVEEKLHRLVGVGKCLEMSTREWHANWLQQGCLLLKSLGRGRERERQREDAKLVPRWDPAKRRSGKVACVESEELCRLHFFYLGVGRGPPPPPPPPLLPQQPLPHQRRRPRGWRRVLNRLAFGKKSLGRGGEGEA